MTLLRTESFVPLTNLTPSAEPGEFRVTLIQGGDQGRPLTTGQSTSAAPLAATSPSGQPCEPRVTLQSDGDRITSIRVHCSCGQIMDLACVYDPASKPA